MKDAAIRFVSPLGDEPRSSADRRRQNPRYAAIEKKLEIASAIASLSILHRTRKNLTQKQLADRMKTSVTAISRLESGSHNPTLETLSKLAEALGGHVKIDIEYAAEPETGDALAAAQ